VERRLQGVACRCARRGRPAAARAIAQGPAGSARAAIAGLVRGARPRQAEIMPLEARGDRLHVQVSTRPANAESRIPVALHGNLPQWQMLARQANDRLVGGFLNRETLSRLDKAPVSFGGRENALGEQFFA